MSDQPRTPQELYARVRQIGKEQFILEEMIRYGFWPAQGEIPQDPADEIRRKGELQQELNTLKAETRQLRSEQALRKQMLKARLEESRRKRQETKERRERDRTFPISPTIKSSPNQPTKNNDTHQYQVQIRATR